MPLAEEEIERILVVTAHPDDVDFGVAGSVGMWTDKGIDVAYCIATDGDAGGFDPDVPGATSRASAGRSRPRRPSRSG